MYGRSVAISTPAKTLVDCIDRPDLCGGPSELTRIIYASLGEIMMEGLLPVLQAMKSRSLIQRLGFLADAVGRPWPDVVRRALRASIPVSCRSHFGRPDRREGDIGYVAEWGLFVNARKSDLLADVM